MEIKATDLSARLLATENLSVVRANVRTASFDIRSRVLTLPMWKDMTPEIEDMLVGHEVGHALYTGEEYIKPIEENRKLQGYLNILEDVRIEKLIKRKYPGLRKRMNEGYRQLNERDFFGLAKVQDFSQVLLIDRINLYFKAGFSCGVTFTSVEKEFVNRAEKTETIEEVIHLAQEIYEFSKQEMEERKKNASSTPEDVEEDEDEEDGEYGDFDDSDDFDDLEELEEIETEQKTTKGSQSTDSEELNEKELQSKTEKHFQQMLDDLADNDTEYKYWKLYNKYPVDPVIDFKRILNETKETDSYTPQRDPNGRDKVFGYWTDEDIANFYTKHKAEFESFKTESSRTVNYLVKEFEMKKSAQLYKRAQTSKVGSLDMRKIYAYKLKDDLFKRVTVLPEGKNHGMVMLVDWSGSMGNVIKDTLKQVINLAMFCNRVQIPYRVYAFTTNYAEEHLVQNMYEIRERFYKEATATPGNLVAMNFNLLELFSSKMSNVEFNTMVKRVLNPLFITTPGYGLSGTPLNESLSWMYHNLGSFVKNNAIEKMTFITLTDGDGSSLNGAGARYFDDYRVDTSSGQYRRIKIKHLIREETTQKTYELSRDPAKQTETILRMIKDRHNINIVGFHICRNAKRDLYQFVDSNISGYAGDKGMMIENWRKAFRQDGFASIKNTGRDDLFLLPQSSTRIDDGELEISSTENAKTIARNFGKYLNVKKTSRVLLNRFIAIVA